ncbi:unnamed protein product [Closterium sp. NIES-54]
MRIMFPLCYPSFLTPIAFCTRCSGHSSRRVVRPQGHGMTILFLPPLPFTPLPRPCSFIHTRTVLDTAAGVWCDREAVVLVARTGRYSADALTSSPLTPPLLLQPPRSIFEHADVPGGEASSELTRRCRHAAASAGNIIFVYGGLRGGIVLDDLLIADDTPPKQLTLPPSAGAPAKEPVFRSERKPPMVEMDVAQPYVCREYSLAELTKATGEWAEGNRIGSGGFGAVYKAVSPHDGNQAWAVKRARVLTNDFHREVKEMASKSHPHLVRLLGYCIDFDPSTRTMEQLLVYELMPNGDLDSWIGPGVSSPLSLQQRLDVLIGVAKGLQYLHDFRIVHRDIKPANILLDGKMQAKVADFGLVKLLGGTSVATSEATTRLVGTLGYLDPEYCSSHKPSPAVDVYSFGLVMLVVLTGLKAVLVIEDDHVNIKRWARVDAGLVEDEIGVVESFVILVPPCPLGSVSSRPLPPSAC